MPKGGLAPRRKGDAFEVAVLKDLETMGRYCARLRQGGGECADLVVLEKCQDATENKSCSLGLGVHHVYLIQCKAGKVGKRAEPLMSPAEREALRAKAEKWNAVPLLAYKRDGEIAYKRV